MSLADWQKNGWLRAHKTSGNEISELLAIVDRDIGAGAIEQLAADWRFNIAYNAVLQCAIAALAAAGFEPEKGGNHHFRALASLELTIGLKKSEVAVLEAHRKKRNVTEYERSGAVSDAEVESIRKLAAQIEKTTRAWLRAEHPGLVALKRK